MSNTNTQNILFIDSAVGDISSLLASVDPSFEVVLLSADRSGLEQIAQALAGRTGVDAVHVISHGGPGYLQLGDATLDLEGLNTHSESLATISAALSDNADLLLYGCDVAAGEAGAAFISALANATGADVAASVDPTGPTLLGGDAQLESSTGPIDAEVLSLIGIENLLAAPSNAGFENNLTGWTINDTAVGTGGTYPAGSNNWVVNPYGTKMAVLTPGGSEGEKTAAFTALGINAASQTYLNNQFGNPTNYAYMTTSVYLTAGETFQMAWNYVSTDYEPFNDGSIATFVNTNVPSDQSMTIKPGAQSNAVTSTGQVVILGATNKGTGNYSTGSYGSTGWQLITFTAGQAGNYTVGFAVFNLDDTAYNPYLFVDQAQGTTTLNGGTYNPIAPDGNAPPPPVTNAAPTFSATTHDNGSTLTDTANDDSFATLTGKVNASDSNSDPLTFAVSGATSGTTVKVGTYGTFTITNTSTGTFTYVPNDAAIEARKTNASDSFTVTVSDGKGGSATTTVTFTISAANDTTAFGGTTTGAVAEDGTASATGTVTASDRDTGDAAITASAATSVYGTFVVNSAGQWTYTLNNSAAAVQGLTEGQTVNDVFSVGTAGGASQQVTITITGQNDRPTLSANAALLTQAEESVDTAATSIATLLGGRFADVDTGATFAGVLVSGNAATAGQGVWQYLPSGSDSVTGWLDIPATGLSTSNALALAATSLIRFKPAPDYNGTPGTLTVYAADNVYAGVFSTGAGPVYANTSAAGVSTSGVAVSITITPVNDAPVFDGGNLTIGLTETAAADTAVTLVLAGGSSLTGILDASDADGDAMSYAIQGGKLVEGSYVIQGTYGQLTLNTTTKAWAYTPNKFQAIDALEAGKTASEVFTFKVTDSAGASATKTLTVSITGSNDTPVLKAVVDDEAVIENQSFSGAGSWTYQIPAATFTDAEGTGLTYSVAVVNGEGALVGDGTLDNNASWLTFNESTRTFSGNPPAGWNNAPLNLRVTATDGQNASVSDTFMLTLSGTGNQPPVVANPLQWAAAYAPKEVTTVTFGSALGGTTIAFDGSDSITLGSKATGAEVATAFGTGTTNYNAVQGTGDDANKLTLTAKVAGERTDFSVGSFDVSGGNYTVAVTQEGADATTESWQVQFKDGAALGSGTLTALGTSVMIEAEDTAAEVASKVATALASNPDWSVAVKVPHSDKVDFVAKTPGAASDLSASDFVISGPSLATNVGVFQQGFEGIREIVNITFGSLADGVTASFTFDGKLFSLTGPKTAIEVAQAFFDSQFEETYKGIWHVNGPP